MDDSVRRIGNGQGLAPAILLPTYTITKVSMERDLGTDGDYGDGSGIDDDLLDSDWLTMLGHL